MAEPTDFYDRLANAIFLNGTYVGCLLDLCNLCGALHFEDCVCLSPEAHGPTCASLERLWAPRGTKGRLVRVVMVQAPGQLCDCSWPRVYRRALEVGRG